MAFARSVHKVSSKMLNEDLGLCIPFFFPAGWGPRHVEGPLGCRKDQEALAHTCGAHTGCRVRSSLGREDEEQDPKAELNGTKSVVGLGA